MPLILGLRRQVDLCELEIVVGQPGLQREVLTLKVLIGSWSKLESWYFKNSQYTRDYIFITWFRQLLLRYDTHGINIKRKKFGKVDFIKM